MDKWKGRYEKAFSQLGPSQVARERILQMSPSPTPGRYLRRLSGAAAAAVLMLALLGCALVGVVYGDSIQTWFVHHWEAVNGGTMSEGQAAVIDRLTQDLGLSQTIDGVTVTVDSATVGDDTFFLLLRVEGLSFSRRWNYAFDQMEMSFSPDPIEENSSGLWEYGFQYQGLDGDGAALMMMDMGYALAEDFFPDSTPLSVHLTLTDLVQSGSDSRDILTHGAWEFTFTLDRSQIPEPLPLADTTVLFFDSERGDEVPVILTHVQVTNTGIRFQYRAPGIHIDTERPRAILASGIEVGCGGGYGTVLEDGETVACSYTWSVPVALGEVRAIRIGSTEIPIP